MDTSLASISASDFPLVIECLDRAGEVVWSETIQEPGALYVPPLAKTYGPVSTRITFAGGGVMEAYP